VFPGKHCVVTLRHQQAVAYCTFDKQKKSSTHSVSSVVRQSSAAPLPHRRHSVHQCHTRPLASFELRRMLDGQLARCSKWMTESKAHRLTVLCPGSGPSVLITASDCEATRIIQPRSVELKSSVRRTSLKYGCGNPTPAQPISIFLFRRECGGGGGNKPRQRFKTQGSEHTSSDITSRARRRRGHLRRIARGDGALTETPLSLR